MTSLLEGIPLGEKFKSIGRTIGEGDLSAITNVTWNIGELHSNAEFMKHTEFGNRLLHGSCVLACLVGLDGVSGSRVRLRERNIQAVALLSYENVRFTAPVVAGDTIWNETEIIEARATKDPERGLMRLRGCGVKQTGEQVCEYTQVFLFRKLTETPATEPTHVGESE